MFIRRWFTPSRMRSHLNSSMARFTIPIPGTHSPHRSPPCFARCHAKRRCCSPGGWHGGSKSPGGEANTAFFSMVVSGSPNMWYISGIYCQLGDYISPIPPIRGTRNNHWLFIGVEDGELKFSIDILMISLLRCWIFMPNSWFSCWISSLPVVISDRLPPLEADKTHF